MEKDWARLHRLYDPQDLIRDREVNGDVRRDQGNDQLARRNEEDFRRRIDEADSQRDEESW